ncbi:hypothetical protein ACJJIF_12260 [Microbulbifer sp. SSSA002]|uniref:hypothetical protein n=1 Tax=Microbulbifer sp. SSSA002 TaxID=3243376 RepID=UPI004039B1B2
MDKISCKFKFECDKRWADLTETSNPTIRHCHTCEKAVYLAEEQEDFEIYAQEEKCVAIEAPSFSMAGMPIGNPPTEYEVVIEKQKSSAFNIAILRDIFSGDISLSEAHSLYSERESRFAGLSWNDATALSEQLTSANIINRIEETG